MSLPFKPHIIALLCSAGLLAAAGTLYVQSRTPATIAEPPAQQAPAPAASTTQPVAATYTQAQIDQWVAPIALYPDSLLSQVLMASTYPDNVLQAVQWSQDNPAMKGDAAVQAVASQPWDPSVKSLVAFPALLAMMGENPPWVENLGNAFLAQPHDVMDSVQRLRAIAQQTGTLKSTPQQKVIVTPAAPVSASSSTAATATAHTAAPAPTQVIKIEPTNPQGQLLIKRLTLRLAHFAIWQDENITAGAQHALAPVVQLQRLRHIAPLIVQRYAKMQTQRVLDIKIQRQNFAARPRQRIG